MKDQEVVDIFKALDASHDEEVHYSEFLAAMISSRITLHESLLRGAFERFDADHSGFITSDDLRLVLGDSFEGAKVGEIIAEVDQSGEGKVSYGDFVEYLRC